MSSDSEEHHSRSSGEPEVGSSEEANDQEQEAIKKTTSKTRRNEEESDGSSLRQSRKSKKKSSDKKKKKQKKDRGSRLGDSRKGSRTSRKEKKAQVGDEKQESATVAEDSAAQVGSASVSLSSGSSSPSSKSPSESIAEDEDVAAVEEEEEEEEEEATESVDTAESEAGSEKSGSKTKSKTKKKKSSKSSLKDSSSSSNKSVRIAPGGLTRARSVKFEERRNEYLKSATPRTIAARSSHRKRNKVVLEEVKKRYLNHAADVNSKHIADEERARRKQEMMQKLRGPSVKDLAAEYRLTAEAESESKRLASLTRNRVRAPSKRRAPSRRRAGSILSASEAVVARPAAAAPDASSSSASENNVSLLAQATQAAASRQQSVADQERAADNARRQSNEAFRQSLQATRQNIKSMYRSAITRTVMDKHINRLVQCKGKRRVYVQLVEPCLASLNQGDTFVLDGPDRTVWVWSGTKSNRMESVKGFAIALIFKNHEYASKATIKKIDRFSDKDDLAEFLKILPGEGEIAPEESGGDDHEAEQRFKTNWSLERLDFAENDSSDPKCTRVNENTSLKMKMLESKHMYILDCQNEFYVWFGIDSSETHKAAALEFAERVFAERYPDAAAATAADEDYWKKCVRVAEGAEAILFREKFSDWPDMANQKIVRPRFTKRSPAAPSSTPKVERKFDVTTILEPKRPEVEFFTDGLDEEHLMKIWIIKGVDWSEKRQRFSSFVRTDLPHKDYGILYSECCYLIMYKYLKQDPQLAWSESGGRGRAERRVLYYWQGKNASKQLTGSCALIATQLFDELKSSFFIQQQHASQERHDRQFLRLFRDGRLIVKNGDYFASEKNSEGKTNVFHVSGHHDDTVHAMESSRGASSLVSIDCSVISTPTKVFVWNGKLSSNTKRQVALTVAERLANRAGSGFRVGLREEGDSEEEATTSSSSSSSSSSAPKSVIQVQEGEENDAFWSALDTSDPSSVEYASAAKLHLNEPPSGSLPRLFHVTQRTGIFELDEIFDFTQASMNVPGTNDPFLVLCWDCIYVWKKAMCPTNKVQWALSVAEELADALQAKQGSSERLSVQSIKSRSEPVEFKALFHAWDEPATRKWGDPASAIPRLATAASIGNVVSAAANSPRAMNSSVPSAAASASSASTPASAVDSSSIPLAARFKLRPVSARSTPPKSPRASPEVKKPVWARNPTPASALSVESSAVVSTAPSGRAAPVAAVTAQPSAELISPSAALSEDELPSFSYAMLSGPPSGWDPAVDPTRRHFHLSDAEFETVLKMDKAKFRSLPRWKQTQLKKDFALF